MLSLALGLMSSVATAQQREVWTCTYIGFGDSHEAEIIQLAVAGKELHNLTTKEKMTITVNNAHGIVAVGSVIETARRDAPVEMLAKVVLIDRRSDDINFNLTFASTVQRRNANRQGRCVRD